MPITTTRPVDGSDATWVLPNSNSYITENLVVEKTMARGWTKDRWPIVVTTFRRQPPPVPSNLFVYCPGGGAPFFENPRVLCIVDDLILLRVAIGCPPDFISMLKCEYFIYRANPRNPSLDPIPNPAPLFFLDREVGLLPREDHYIITVLVGVQGDEFNLLLFNSETRSWNTKKLSVEAPLEFEVELPRNAGRLFRHRTRTMITLGGEDNTMGFVDLWRGILLCDVLCNKPMLCNVPLPFLKNHLTGFSHNGKEQELSYHPRAVRGIAFIKGCLKFVELVIDDTPVFDKTSTGLAYFQVHNWRITTSSNDKMTGSWKDWKEDCMVQASGIVISNQMKSAFHKLGLLLGSRDNDATAVQALQNLFVTDLVPSITDDGVVYLVARLNFCHPKAWVLAVDLRNNTVQDVAKFDNHNDSGGAEMYSPSAISEQLL